MALTEFKAEEGGLGFAKSHYKHSMADTLGFWVALADFAAEEGGLGFAKSHYKHSMAVTLGFGWRWQTLRRRKEGYGLQKVTIDIPWQSLQGLGGVGK